MLIIVTSKYPPLKIGRPSWRSLAMCLIMMMMMMFVTFAGVHGDYLNEKVTVSKCACVRSYVFSVTDSLADSI